jgi:hypothetical protein
MEQRQFTTDDYIPMAYWGKDHWTTLAYAETVIVDCGGFQVGADAHMRAGRRNYRVMAQECAHPKRTGKSTSSLAVVMELAYSTKLNDGQVLSGHDDWSCIQDMAAEGLFAQGPDAVEPGVVLTLSAKGNLVANALREFKRNKGAFVNFRGLEPAAVPAPALCAGV